MILTFSVLAVVLFVFGAGFVFGVVYGVHRAQADEAERLLRRQRYG